MDYGIELNVSNTGRIRSKDKTVFSASRIGKGRARFMPGKILKPTPTRSGYLLIGLYKNAKCKKFTIHRLVAEAFVDNPQKKPEINHQDGNKLNNAFDNLIPCTRSENCKHASDTGLLPMAGQFNVSAKLQPHQIIEIRELFLSGWSQKKIAAQYNVTHANIHCIVRRKSWTHLTDYTK